MSKSCMAGGLCLHEQVLHGWVSCVAYEAKDPCLCTPSSGHLQATNMARYMVTECGFDDTIGPVYVSDQGASEELKQRVDERVSARVPFTNSTKGCSLVYKQCVYMHFNHQRVVVAIVYSYNQS